MPLPERAYVGRINSVLRRQNPPNNRVTVIELKRTYADAYALVGDYCGGGQGAIRQELLGLVNATFRAAGL